MTPIIRPARAEDMDAFYEKKNQGSNLYMRQHQRASPDPLGNYHKNSDLPSSEMFLRCTGHIWREKCSFQEGTGGSKETLTGRKRVWAKLSR